MTFDAAGNLLTGGTATYTYSDRGRLKSATVGTTTTNYTYNALGQRVSKLTGGMIGNLIQYLYDEQGHLLGEYDFYGKPLQETVYLGDQPIAVLNQTITAAATGVQVDNTDTANVTVVGTWPVDSTVAGFIGQSHPATTVADSFTWKLTLPTVGKYLFQARWPADASRTGNATYAAFSTDGISTRLVDQKTNSNTWTDLRIKLSGAANTLATLKLNPTTTGTVAADAVRALPLTVTTTVNYVFTDHLNTPRVITRASDNQMVWRWDSADPFGNDQPNPNPAGLGTFTYNPRFTGQLYDAETGLYYNYHRSYSPSVGSYTQSDPIGLRGGVNTYAYVGGNPVNLVDPFGLQPNQSCVNGCTLVGGVIGGGVGYLGGGALGGIGGTLALPGGGTIAGAVGGAEVGGAAGAAAGSAAGHGVGEKLCPDDNNQCDMEFVREVYYGGETKTCVYKEKAGMFTFPQDKELACMPVDKQRCLVDTSFMGPKARAVYGK